MLVLAMEFSRGAQRGLRATDIKEQTDERTGGARASGRLSATGAGRHRFGGSESPRAAP
jgi:hypothetical protein